MNKSLKKWTKKISNKAGRNHSGKITAWHRGGGHKKLYREIDFIREKTYGIVCGIEYDPNRGAFLARIFNPDNKTTTYILSPAELKEGDVIRSNSDNTLNGHSQKLRHIPTGTSIFNLSKKPGAPGIFIKAPGTRGILIKKTTKQVQVRLQSGQKYWINSNALATIGIVSNFNKKYQKLYKAGQKIWVGKRPKVRGVAMNPIDHPHGGGEGKTSGGRPSVTPWGIPTTGKRTKKK